MAKLFTWSSELPLQVGILRLLSGFLDKTMQELPGLLMWVLIWERSSPLLVQDHHSTCLCHLLGAVVPCFAWILLAGCWKMHHRPSTALVWFLQAMSHFLRPIIRWKDHILRQCHFFKQQLQQLWLLHSLLFSPWGKLIKRVEWQDFLCYFTLDRA